MTGIVAKLLLSAIVSGGATVGINEAVKTPVDTIDVVLAWDAERTVADTHARITLSESDQKRLNLENKLYLLHITKYDPDGEPYKAGETLTIPLEVAGFEINTVGYTGYSFYSPEKYLTRHEG